MLRTRNFVYINVCRELHERRLPHTAHMKSPRPYSLYAVHFRKLKTFESTWRLSMVWADRFRKHQFHLYSPDRTKKKKSYLLSSIALRRCWRIALVPTTYAGGPVLLNIVVCCGKRHLFTSAAPMPFRKWKSHSLLLLICFPFPFVVRSQPF